MAVKNKFLNSIALSISFIGSPFLVLTAMLLTLAWHYKEGVLQFYSYLLVTSIFVLIIPIAYMIENIEGLKFVDLHLTKKEDREKVLLVTSLSVLIGYFMLRFIGMPRPLLLIELVGLFNLILMAIITFKMKLSIHLAVLTMSATLVVYFLGLSYTWLYALLLPLAWARLYREKHSMSEIFFGTIIGFAVTFLTIQVFGLL